MGDAQSTKTVSVTARLTPKQAGELAQLAKRDDRSISAELRRAVRFYLRARRPKGETA